MNKKRKWLLPVCIVACAVTLFFVAILAILGIMSAKGYGISAGRLYFDDKDTSEVNDAHGVNADISVAKQENPLLEPDDDFLLKLANLRGEEDPEYWAGKHYKYVNAYPKDGCKLPDVLYGVKYSDKETAEGFKDIEYVVGSYKIFSTYDEYLKYADVPEGTDNPFKDGNSVVICIERRYDYECGEEIAFRNLTLIDGEVCIVVDRIGKEITSSDPMIRVDFISLTIDSNLLESLKPEGEIIVIENRIETDELTDFYRDLAKKSDSDDYYQKIDGDTSGVCNKLDKSIKDYSIPIEYSKKYDFFYGRVTVTDYKLISDYASLSEYTVNGKIDEGIFDNNVILYVERCYEIINGNDIGFRDLMLKDGKLYIVVDRQESLINGNEALDPHADFIVIPKDKLPDGIAGEGTIEIVTNIQAK